MSHWQAQLAGSRVLVVGCGATGLSLARFAHAAGAHVRVVDSRRNPPAAEQLACELPAAEIRTGGLDGDALAGIEHVVVSPGVDLRQPLIQKARQLGYEIIGDTEWFARVAKAPVVAITGSNGKSTATAWVGEILVRAGWQVALGGNYGTPALDLLADDVEVYVLELSSFQLELTQQLACRVATVLNISADHIDRHGTIDHYVGLKARIFRATQTALFNRDDAHVTAMTTGSAQMLTFGASPGADYQLVEQGGQLYLGRGGQAWLSAARLSLSGRHNVCNALAVWALTEQMGVDEAVIKQGLQEFTGLAHRCQTVARKRGVRWVNDSKGTNPGAMLASLSAFDEPVVLLAGGQAKDADFAELGPVAARRARTVLVYGQDADSIAAAASGHVHVEKMATLTAAVERAAAIAHTGDVVLLSPGCASFDQFADYQARGQAFTAAVQELVE